MTLPPHYHDNFSPCHFPLESAFEFSRFLFMKVFHQLRFDNMPPKRVNERDWEESFYSMEEKYRQIQKQLNEKESELKLVKVRALKESLHGSHGNKSLLNITNASRHAQNISNNTAPPQSPLVTGKKIASKSTSPSSLKRVSPRGQGGTKSESANDLPVDHTQRRFSSQSTTVFEVDGVTAEQEIKEKVTDLDALLRSVTAPLAEGSSNSWLSPPLFDKNNQNTNNNHDGVGGNGVRAAVHDVATMKAFQTQHTEPYSNSAGVGVFNQCAPSMAANGSGLFSHSTSYAQVPNPSEAVVDPLLMLWGHNSVTAQNNALQQSNATLKAALEESQTILKTNQHDLANQRALTNKLQQQIDESRIELSQVVRERDLAVQKLSNAKNAISQAENLLQVTTDEKEKLRFNLESQIRDLRSRLSSAAENNDALSSDTRTLITELRESGSKVAALQSKLVLLESSHTHQLNVNKTMVGELESLNQQLVSERKKLLSMARDLQANRAFVDERHALESRISQLSQDKLVLEKEHLRLLDDMMTLTQSTASQARGEMRSQLEELSAAAHHWEKVSALLYQDISQRTASHVTCREECDEAKRQRDEAVAAAKSLRQDLSLASAKLDIIWPNHVKDTQLFEDVETMKATFSRIMGAGLSTKGSRLSEALSRFGKGSVNGLTAAPTSQVDFSFLTDAPPEELIRELQAANAALYAELESLKAANDVLTDQLRLAQDANNAVIVAARQEVTELKWKNDEHHVTVAQQCDRIDFLENQVALLRGISVDPSTSLDTLGFNETIAEVFIGQVLSVHGMQGTSGDAFPSLFCAVDFLIHETATTSVVTGYQSFFDMTMAYKFSMDSLFLYYLQTRGLRVQLFRMTGADALNSNEIAPASYELVGEGQIGLIDLISNDRILSSQRPQLRGHVKLYQRLRNADGASGEADCGFHVASVEYSITIRTPFSQSFIQEVRRKIQVADASGQEGPRQSPRANSLHPLSVNTGYLRSAYALLEKVNAITLTFVSFSIPFTIEPLPQLSLYYTIPQVGLEGHIPPPFQIPRYETRFSESDAASVSGSSACKRVTMKNGFTVEREGPCHVVQIRSKDVAHTESALESDVKPYAYQLSKLLGEPIPVVAFDENDVSFSNRSSSTSLSDSNNKSVHYWSLGLIHWDTVLESAVRHMEADLKTNRSSQPIGFVQELKIPMQTSVGENVGTLAVQVALGEVDSEQSQLLLAEKEDGEPQTYSQCSETAAQATISKTKNTPTQHSAQICSLATDRYRPVNESAEAARKSSSSSVKSDSLTERRAEIEKTRFTMQPQPRLLASPPAQLQIQQSIYSSVTPSTNTSCCADGGRQSKRNSSHVGRLGALVGELLVENKDTPSAPMRVPATLKSVARGETGNDASFGVPSTVASEHNGSLV